MQSFILSAKKFAPETVIERFVPVVRSKNASPTWSDVRVALLHFERERMVIIAHSAVQYISTLRIKAP